MYAFKEESKSYGKLVLDNAPHAKKASSLGHYLLSSFLQSMRVKSS